MNDFKIRTFGRKKGRKLSDIKIEQINNSLPNFSIKNNNLLEDFFKLHTNIIFEIGFGYGEYTINKALLNTNFTIIACETYLNGVLALLNKILNLKIFNIFLYNDDARILLEKIPNSCLNEIIILFPDPWLKHRQNKKRLINSDFLNLIKSKLKPQGILFFATDIVEYATFTKNEASKIFQPLFNNINECLKEPEHWIITRYQKKANIEGRLSYFMKFKNTPNQSL